MTTRKKTTKQARKSYPDEYKVEALRLAEKIGAAVGSCAFSMKRSLARRTRRMAVQGGSGRGDSKARHCSMDKR